MHYVVIVITHMLITSSNSLEKSWLNQDVKVSRCILWLSESIPFSLPVYCAHTWARLIQWMSLLWRLCLNEWRRMRRRNLCLAFIQVLYICELFFLRQGTIELFFCSSKTWLLFAVRTENCYLFFVTERSGLLNSCQTCFYPITSSQGVESAVWHLGRKI